MAMNSQIGSRLVSGSLRFFRKSDGATIADLDAASGRFIDANQVYQARFHVPVASIADATGAILLAAIAGYKYRLIDAAAIAVGGAAATVTTVDLVGTQSTAKKLVAWGQAALTQSTILRAGGTGATVLADGASFLVNDENTAITLGKTGGAIGTATYIDVVLTYAIETA